MKTSLAWTRISSGLDFQSSWLKTDWIREVEIQQLTVGNIVRLHLSKTVRSHNGIFLSLCCLNSHQHKLSQTKSPLTRIDIQFGNCLKRITERKNNLIKNQALKHLKGKQNITSRLCVVVQFPHVVSV